jgi:dTDP-glucose 4,6-dehydratase
MKVLVTGGMGFIGSNFIRHLLGETVHSVVNVDKLTYAANPRSLLKFESDGRYQFHQCDIVDEAAIQKVFVAEAPDAVVHLAAESHVDRSIASPSDFIQTNIVGTFNLLSCALDRFESLDSCARSRFRFVHVSTDEVFGSLAASDPLTDEQSRYDPSSPYSASKAGSDHLARAWQVTYGLPVVVTNAANNYGPFQYPEKFIPTIISRAVNGKQIPVYGDGKNVRDWLHVQDHCIALQRVLEESAPGETYNIGADNERSNLGVVHKVCELLDELVEDGVGFGRKHSEMIEFVTDRKGHDFRYALNTEKIRRELAWVPEMSWEAGIRETVQWYLENRSWWMRVENS